jgi:hypothetical protein
VHRVFPSSRKNAASSQRFQFHGVYFGDSGEVVTPFMQVVTYTARDFATLGPSGLRPPFNRYFHSKRELLILCSGYWAGVRPNTSSFDFAEPCVFSKQSLPPIFYDTCSSKRTNALLLPKLRRHFAEFLQNNFLQRLSIFY